MSAADTAVAKQYERWQEVSAKAHKLYDQADRELRKLVKLCKLGRKQQKVVPISESRGVRVKNQFKGDDKVFTPAFCRKYKVDDVPLSDD